MTQTQNDMAQDGMTQDGMHSGDNARAGTGRTRTRINTVGSPTVVG